MQQLFFNQLQKLNVENYVHDSLHLFVVINNTRSFDYLTKFFDYFVFAKVFRRCFVPEMQYCRMLKAQYSPLLNSGLSMLNHSRKTYVTIWCNNKRNCVMLSFIIEFIITMRISVRLVKFPEEEDDQPWFELRSKDNKLLLLLVNCLKALDNVLTTYRMQQFFQG